MTTDPQAMTDANQWTSKPPTEPGEYWWREGPRRNRSDVHRVDSRGPWSMRRGTLVVHGEWWPIPLPKPPEGE